MSADNTTDNKQLDKSARRLQQLSSQFDMASSGVQSAFGAVTQAPEDPLGELFKSRYELVDWLANKRCSWFPGHAIRA